MKSNQPKQKFSYITRILLWLSKTDKGLYIRSPENVQLTRKGLGYLVLFTGVFAFLTASYFTKTLLHQYDEATKTIHISAINIIISYCIGLFFATGIIYIDREIVSAGSRLSALIRLPLAIIIGLVVSVPLKVMLFSERINKELTLSEQVENMDHIGRRNERIFSFETRINDLKQNIDAERNKQAHWRDIMEAEIAGRVREGRTGVAGPGSAYRTAKENFELHQKFEQDYVAEFDMLREEYDDVVERADQEFDRMYVGQSYDFVSQYLQLQKISRENNDLSLLGNFIMSLFILIECIPAFLKLIKEQDEYDAMLQLRTRINRQLSIAMANHVMSKIENDAIQQNYNVEHSSKAVIENISRHMSG